MTESRQATTTRPALAPGASSHGMFLRKCDCGTHSISGEQCAECRKATLQRKLNIGSSDDPLEREADRVSDEVMALPANRSVSHASPRIQRFTGRSSRDEGSVPASVERVLAGSGSPLDRDLQRDLGRRFGYDFSHVRVHTGVDAERSAGEVNAEAYTVGSQIAFGAGRYAPETHAGRMLLAHELAHVVQQNPTVERGGIGLEQAAGSAFASAIGGSQMSNMRLQRKLLVDGSPKDCRALLVLLEKSSGLKLKAVKPNAKLKTVEIQIDSVGKNPPSPELSARLQLIIGDQHQDAELTLGRDQRSFDFGKFPGADSDEPMQAAPKQELNLSGIEAVEAGATGMGLALLTHEIVENYEAHDKRFTGKKTSDVFSGSHEEALRAEGKVAGDIVGSPGTRAAEVQASASPGGDIRTVDDYESYFLVYDQDANGHIHGARVVKSRINVGVYRLKGFAKNSITLPGTASGVIKKIIADLASNPFAVASITSDPKPGFGTGVTRFDVVSKEILNKGKAAKAKGFDIRDFHNFRAIWNGAGAFATEVEVSVDRPDL